MVKKMVVAMALLALVLLIWTPARARSPVRVVVRPAVRVVIPRPVAVYPVMAVSPVLVPSCPSGRYWSRRWQRCLPYCSPGYRWDPKRKRCLLIR